MKKIISAAFSLLLIAVLACSASAVGHTSADQVFGADGVTDRASVGNNDVTGTSLGTITDDKLTLWGWYADEQKITEFGYRYGDNVTLGSAKYTGGGDDSIIAEQAGKLGYADGESVRFRIADIPVMKGENVELYAVAKLADGSTVDIWKVTYTSENGMDMQSGQGTDETPGATQTPSQTTNPQTADAALVTAFALSCIALAGLSIVKKVR
jgi:hypothetical protein